MTEEQKAKLEAPFPPELIEVKLQAVSKDRKRGQVVAYVDARAVMDRLDEVFGLGWSDAYQVLADRTDAEGRRVVEAICYLQANGVTRCDVGEGDTMKAAFSDALKRAAVKFGIGRYLYRLPSIWVELDEYGRFDTAAAKARILGNEAPRAPQQSTPSPSAPAPDASQPKGSGKPTDKQLAYIKALLKKQGAESEEDMSDLLSAALGRDATLEDLTGAEASQVIEFLKSF